MLGWMSIHVRRGLIAAMAIAGSLAAGGCGHSIFGFGSQNKYPAALTPASQPAAVDVAQPAPTITAVATTVPSTRPIARYTVTGIPGAGTFVLVNGDTLLEVLNRHLSTAATRPSTIMLVRRCPEGNSRELIQLDAAGRLLNVKQNYVLRDGDELQFPTAATTRREMRQDHQPTARGAE